MLKKTHLMTFTGIFAFVSCIQGCADDSKGKTTPHSPSSSKEQTAAFANSMEPKVPDNGQDLDMVRLSEAFGHFIGRNLTATPGAEFNIEAIIRGIRDGAQGKPAPMSDEDYEMAMADFQEKAFQAVAQQNLEQAETFLSKNKNAPGVVELEPGKIQYIVVQQGEGPAVEENGTPSINYTGRFLDGTIFGSSDDTGGPVTLSLQQTISGFGKAVVGMKKGEKRKIFIHPDRGYGTMGQLPPNQLLLFEVEIVDPEAQPKLSLSSVMGKNAAHSDGEEDDYDDDDEDDDDDTIGVILDDEDVDDEYDESAIDDTERDPVETPLTFPKH